MQILSANEQYILIAPPFLKKNHIVKIISHLAPFTELTLLLFPFDSEASDPQQPVP